MSVMNSWCERLFLFSLIILVSIFLADYKLYFLPINGIWLLLYVSCVIIFTIWITCVNIQKLLRQNVSFDYNLESHKSYQKLKHVCELIIKYCQSSTSKKSDKNSTNGETPTLEKLTILENKINQLRNSNNETEHNITDSQLAKPTINISTNEIPKEKSIDERIDILVQDIEERFISKWYNLISDEESFSAESKTLLEGIVRRVLQVSVQMDSAKLICGALVILLKHLKEYRKAIKRVNKNGGSIESVYRYSHLGNKSDTALEHFTHRLTANVLREFISWELWNSLPCRLLVSILSKRLTSYLIFYISQPGWLNYKILYQTSAQNDIATLKLDKYLYISLSDVDLSDKLEKTDEKTLEKVEEKPKTTNKISSSTPQLSPKKDSNIIRLPQFQSDNDSEESISKTDANIQSEVESVIEQALTKMITQQTAPILQRAEKSGTKSAESEVKSVSPESSAKDSPNGQTPYKPTRSEPVKIHSAKSTSKRWDESELANVSLGQDLLALEGLDSAGIQGFSGRRLWGFNAELNDTDNEKPGNPLWDVNESWLKDKEVEKEIVEEVRSSPPKTKRKELKELVKKASPPSSIPHCLRPATTSATAFVTNTIKPIAIKPNFLAGNVTASTLHNMRELQQSTVNNVVRPVSNVTEKAMHKIGDLQDEAVGVVEGIFDFGMAGLRKGLRLTGLQDINNEMGQKPTKLHHSNNEPVKHSPKNVPKLVKLGHVTSASEETKTIQKVALVENPESVWINPIAKEESPNGFENQMLLEKSPNTFENEITLIEEATEVPEITESNLFLVDSPEYEETADLASTISKLRSLLQQKSSESSLNTPAVSPMPIDDKSCPTPTEPVITDVTRGDGGMQRFARTVTGMFNTFKTALPGNVSEQMQNKSEQWIFIENEVSNTDLPSLLNSLLIERRDYCTIDTAYEAIDSLDVLTESVNSQIGKIQWDNQIYEDELDDLDTSIPITKALLDVVCECLQDTQCALNQEPIMKALLILGGAKAEKKLTQYSEKILRYVNKVIGPLPKNLDDNVLPMDLEKFVTDIEKSFPYYLKEIFGHGDIKTGLKFFISSLQSVKINQDIILQFFEHICSQLVFASSQMSPTPSA